jgi:hypothetical protein
LKLIHTFSLTSSLSVEDVPISLGSILERPTALEDRLLSRIDAHVDDSGQSDRYQGTIGPRHFLLTRPTAPFRSFQPIVSGSIAAQPSGSRVDVRVGPPTSDVVAIAILCILALGGGLAVFLTAPSFWPASLFLIGISISWWVALHVTTARQATRVKALLATVLRAEPTVA